jgi:hypothetical protein
LGFAAALGLTSAEASVFGLAVFLVVFAGAAAFVFSGVFSAGSAFGFTGFFSFTGAFFSSAFSLPSLYLS